MTDSIDVVADGTTPTQGIEFHPSTNPSASLRELSRAIADYRASGETNPEVDRMEASVEQLLRGRAEAETRHASQSGWISDPGERVSPSYDRISIPGNWDTVSTADINLNTAGPPLFDPMDPEFHEFYMSRRQELNDRDIDTDRWERLSPATVNQATVHPAYHNALIKFAREERGVDVTDVTRIECTKRRGVVVFQFKLHHGDGLYSEFGVMRPTLRSWFSSQNIYLNLYYMFTDPIEDLTGDVVVKGTIQWIKENNFTNREEFDVLKYFESAAQDMRIDLQKIDLRPYILNEYGDIITDENKLNVILLQISDIIDADESLQTSAKQIAAAMEECDDSTRDHLLHLQKEKKNLVKEMVVIAQELSNKKVKFDSIADQIPMFKHESFKRELNKILQHNFYEYVGLEKIRASWDGPGEYTSVKLQLKTNSVWIRKEDKGIGIDYQVGFGSYLVEVSIPEMEIKVLPFEDNIFKGSHCHPFVGSGGSVCWGDEADDASDYENDGQIYKLLQLLATLLTTYDGSNPYVDLHTFQVIYDAKNPESAKLDKKYEMCDSCGEYYYYAEDKECQRCGASADEEEDEQEEEYESNDPF